MLVYGKNVVREILESNTKIYKVFLDKNFNDDELLKLVHKKNLKIFHIDRNKLNKMCDNGINQGIALDIEEYHYLELDDIVNDEKANFIVMLDQLEDPHNFGAIIRTCECAGVDYIIIPKKRSVNVTSTVYKTSVGALNNMKIVEVTNLNNTIDKLKKLGFWVYGADAGSKDYRSVKYDSKTLLIIGSEGFGMKRIVKEACDEIVSIPLKGNVTSLNASVAAGILIYEIEKYK